jgi:hypothetical protein
MCTMEKTFVGLYAIIFLFLYHFVAYVGKRQMDLLVEHCNVGFRPKIMDLIVKWTNYDLGFLI